MPLDPDTNYIVSGLERSGTSLMMQILLASGVPIAYDEKSRPADDNNPRGYYELEGGKIISRLEGGTFPMHNYKGKFIKVTAFGLQYLPSGAYNIIYMLRDLDEVLRSQGKMIGSENNETYEKDKSLLSMINESALSIAAERKYSIVKIDYRKLIDTPETELEVINRYLDGIIDVEKSMKAIDKSLYRNRKI
ncbi:nucleotide pyrophosphatase [Chloroflexota bacterium]